MPHHPSYFGVFRTFLRNSLLRELTFRSNFAIQCVSSVSWTLMIVGFYLIIFSVSPGIADWDKYQFFVFLATTMFVNSIVQMFFMPNAEEFSELIRRGGLDFALLKPIDTQFLVSLQKTEWSSLANFATGLVLLTVSLWQLTHRPVDPLVLEPQMFLLYPFYILCGVAILYSLMISLSATSIWLGRNQTLYDFWFYITNFARYPMEIYDGAWGTPLRLTFTFIIPVLVVVNVPARIMARPLHVDWRLAGFAVVATVACLLVSRWIFTRALLSYRSASS